METVIMRSALATIFCITVLSLSCSHNSTEPKQGLPDLVIRNVTYAYVPGRLAGLIADSLWIQNIGQGDFYGLLYVSSASEKYFQKYALFSTCTLVYCDWNSDSLTPARIAPDQTIIVEMGGQIPTDTNVVRFHIETDNKGMKPGPPYLPTYQESNYDNNDFLLTYKF